MICCGYCVGSGVTDVDDFDDFDVSIVSMQASIAAGRPAQEL